MAGSGSRPVGETKFRLLVDLLDERVEHIVEELVTRAAHEWPAWSGAARPEILELQRRIARESIHAEITALREGRFPTALPPADAEFARAGARIGAPVASLSWSFRAGHAAQWQQWLDLVEREEHDPDVRRALLERGSAFFFAYADGMIQMVSDQYAEERERLLRNTEQRRFHLVRELLDGAHINSSTLGYELDVWHVAMVIWGPQASEAVRALSGGLDAQLLSVGVIEDTYWVWTGTRREPGADHLEKLARLLPNGGRAALGGSHHGTHGFRQTHREARDAHRIAQTTTNPVTRYEDVALVALAARDEEDAHAFVAAQLRGLDGDDTRTRRLRETLDTYLTCAMNASAAAHKIGVHEQTVTNRLRAIEQRTGRPIPEHHAELAIALQLQRLLSIHRST